jgi:hypothetical protein
MAKSKKGPARGQAPAKRLVDSLHPAASGAAQFSAIAPPTKKPSLLAISVVLFSLWFVYLLVVALGG